MFTHGGNMLSNKKNKIYTTQMFFSPTGSVELQIAQRNLYRKKKGKPKVELQLNPREEGRRVFTVYI